MLETLLLCLLLLLVAVFGVVLGVHLQAAKAKTDCGCGKGPNIEQRLKRLEAASLKERQQQ